MGNLGVVKQLRFFYSTMILTVGIALVPLFYLITATPDCGPHAGRYVRDVLTEYYNGLPYWFTAIFNVISDYIWTWLVIFLCTMYISYLHRRRRELKVHRDLLQDQLEEERTEKMLMIKDNNLQ